LQIKYQGFLSQLLFVLQSQQWSSGCLSDKVLDLHLPEAFLY
jgi:ATPase-IB_hvy: heavy metal translocating P-type ATPase